LKRIRSRVPQSEQPFLCGVSTKHLDPDQTRFPFSIPAFAGGVEIAFTSKVTFLVGENGSGKSTLLEGIAAACGFPLRGGTTDHRTDAELDDAPLARALRLAWRPKVSAGFFFRAESFFNFAVFIDAVGDLERYGGDAHLHSQSHGESFLSLFRNRFTEGLFLLDEPEAALSPQRQLAFLKVLHDLERDGRSQFIIASHSPILLHYPGATILSLDGPSIEAVTPNETEHVRLTKDFLDNPALYLRAVLAD